MNVHKEIDFKWGPPSYFSLDYCTLWEDYHQLPLLTTYTRWGLLFNLLEEWFIKNPKSIFSNYNRKEDVIKALQYRIDHYAQWTKDTDIQEDENYSILNTDGDIRLYILQDNPFYKEFFFLKFTSVAS
jgi:hypothetical protein